MPARLRPVLACAVLLLAPSPASSQKPAPADVADIKSDLRIYTDGKDHYLVLVPLARCLEDDPHEDAKEAALFYGDGKDFHRLRTHGGSADCGDKKSSTTFWDPRIAALWKTSIDEKNGKVSVRCDDRVTELTMLSRDETQKLLGAAKFWEALWDRLPYGLARDDRGTYYYVDRSRDPQRRYDFRLYVGPRGTLKPQKLKNVVSDSEGDIFSSPRGELRLVLSRKEASWIRGKKKTPLTIVPVEQNVQLIYNELGVYVGQRLGTPCDDL